MRKHKHHHNPEKRPPCPNPEVRDNDDAEVIFVGVEHVKEDAETFFVRVISTSKPVISNVLNRVTRDSSSRRMKDHVNPDPSCRWQTANLRTPASEPAAVSPVSQCVWGGRGSSIISSLHLNLISKRARRKLSFLHQNYLLCVPVPSEPFSH